MFEVNLKTIIGVVVMAVLLSSCSQQEKQSKRASLDYVKSQLNELPPVEMSADLSQLSKSEKQVVKKLVKAGQIIDELFLLQVDRDNLEIRKKLRQEGQQGEPYLNLFNIMFGKWNRLDHNKPFLDSEKKPKGAGYYPTGMTKKEFNQYIEQHPEQEEEFTSHYTIIKRAGDSLRAVPYHENFQNRVKKVAQLLKEAANITQDSTLQKFLKLRAEDLLTDKYFDSNMAWMELSGDLEVVIGPYEVYEDQLFGYKAAYETFVCKVDQQASQKLANIGEYQRKMESNLPISDKHKNMDRGYSSPIKVVNEIFTAGDTKAGIQTIAFNLPNDERVREAKGSKKVMLKNKIRAKFDKILKPIAKEVVGKEEYQHIKFDAYFNRILMHEVSHGLGPGTIKIDGEETTVSDELKELYPMIEECKADILSIYNMLYLMEQGVFEQARDSTLFSTYLGGMFRSIRFGIEESHGGGIAIQFNYMMDKGGFYEENGKLRIDIEKAKKAAKSLSQKVLMIEATGDYSSAKSLVDKYARKTPIMEKYLGRLEHIPTDIRPRYTVFEQLDIARR